MSTISVVVSLSVDDLEFIGKESKPTIYPNPFNGVINFKINEDYRKVEVQVMNILGQTILSQRFTNHQKLEILTSQLPSGSYLIEIAIDGHKTFRRLVKH